MLDWFLISASVAILAFCAWDCVRDARKRSAR